MIIKSQEACAMWCPMGRVAVISNGATINDPSTEYRTNCIGERCMMWRKAPTYHGGVSTGYPRGDGLGYCGLAGKPEVFVV